MTYIDTITCEEYYNNELTEEDILDMLTPEEWDELAQEMWEATHAAEARN